MAINKPDSKVVTKVVTSKQVAEVTKVHVVVTRPLVEEATSEEAIMLEEDQEEEDQEEVAEATSVWKRLKQLVCEKDGLNN